MCPFILTRPLEVFTLGENFTRRVRDAKHDTGSVFTVLCECASRVDPAVLLLFDSPTAGLLPHILHLQEPRRFTFVGFKSGVDFEKREDLSEPSPDKNDAHNAFFCAMLNTFSGICLAH